MHQTAVDESAQIVIVRGPTLRKDHYGVTLDEEHLLSTSSAGQGQPLSLIQPVVTADPSGGLSCV